MKQILLRGKISEDKKVKEKKNHKRYQTEEEGWRDKKEKKNE